MLSANTWSVSIVNVIGIVVLRLCCGQSMTLSVQRFGFALTSGHRFDRIMEAHVRLRDLCRGDWLNRPAQARRSFSSLDESTRALTGAASSSRIEANTAKFEVTSLRKSWATSCLASRSSSFTISVNHGWRKRFPRLVGICLGLANLAYAYATGRKNGGTVYAIPFLRDFPVPMTHARPTFESRSISSYRGAEASFFSSPLPLGDSLMELRP